MLVVGTAAVKTANGGLRTKRNDEETAAPPAPSARFRAQRNPSGGDEFPLRPLPQLSAAAEQPLQRSQRHVSYAGAGIGVGRKQQIKQLGARRKGGVFCERRGNAREEFSIWHGRTLGKQKWPGRILPGHTYSFGNIITHISTCKRKMQKTEPGAATFLESATCTPQKQKPS
jgi:hypothetical protein